ncbi:MAG: hypothetical protein ACSHX3_13385 [Litorimonas sp.]
MSVVKVIIGLGVALIVVGTAAYAFWLKPQLEFAEIATAFGAKKFCSCLYVAELTVDQCKADFTDDVSMATFTSEDQAVTVEVLGGRMSSRAVYNEGLGCVLNPAN